MHNSTSRFESKVSDYIRYRPHYPDDILNFLYDQNILKPQQSIADIGCGTGFSAIPFLKKNHPVSGIEPNTPMRKAAEECLKSFPGFSALNATAENTSLPRQSVHHIFAGQAFHWFDREKTKAEFKRILKPGGFVLLSWNDRKYGPPFLEEYENLLQEFGTDYNLVNHRRVDDAVMDDFFGKGNWQQKIFYNAQIFDFQGLKGRLDSSSYIPAADTKEYLDMITALKNLFDKHQQNGTVNFEYDCRLYYGKFA